jgi:hypothetical protein
MTAPTIIGLTGLAGTGKDSVRAILESQGFIGMAFADPIRAMIRALFTASAIDPMYMDQRDLKESVIPALGVSYRHLAQTLGTEWGRSIAPDLWLRLASSYFDDVKWGGKSPRVVISDVRFSNEAAWVRAKGGVVWRVVRFDARPVRLHASEAGVAGIHADDAIFNQGDLADLKPLVLAALNRLGIAPAYTMAKQLCQCTTFADISVPELDTNRCFNCGKAVLA